MAAPRAISAIAELLVIYFLPPTNGNTVGHVCLYVCLCCTYSDFWQLQPRNFHFS